MKRHHLVIAAVILAAGVVGWASSLRGPLATVEAWLADLRVATLSEPMPPRDDIVIVAIGESTFAQLGHRTPVDRQFLANLVEAVQAAGARAIGIDLFFAERTSPGADAALTAALNRATVPVVLAWADGQSTAGLVPAWQEAMWREFRASLTNTQISDGLAIVLKDGRDQTARQLLPARRVDATVQVGFAAALAMAIGADFVPTTQPLLYYGRPTPATPAFLALPAESVRTDIAPLWQRIAPLLAGKIVLIGVDLPIEDRHRTPFSVLPGVGLMSGVELHAHMLAQLLDRRTAPALPRWFGGVLALAAAAAAGTLMVMGWPAWMRAGAAVALLVAIWVAAFLLYPIAGAAIPLLSPTLALLLAAGGCLLYAEARQRQKSRFMRRAFRRYVSPQVLAEIRRDPARLTLGGEQRLITVLLTDLTSSVELAERLPAAQLVSLLNEYLDGISRLVLDHEGTVDKFIGDAVMAMFGAPLDQPDHAARAVRCALAINRFGDQFAARWATRGIAVGATRIGVHTGHATVGNFGGRARFDYTAIGDVTNTCARLEAANKRLGTQILVSEATAQACPDLPFRPVGELRLRGRQKPLRAMQPLLVAGSTTADDYRAAYALLECHDAGAQAAFAALLARAPEDALVRFHHDRLSRGEAGTIIEVT